MTGKRAARAGWRGPFLRALERGASASCAAHEAKVHYQNAYAARRRDEAFAADWAKAVDKGRAALIAGELPVLAGDEIVRASKNGRPCIMRAGAGRWSADKERAFLNMLGATGNVTKAAEAAGVSRVAVYKRRRSWPGFAEEWDACQEQGWARVEMAVVRAAADTLEGAPAGDEDKDGAGEVAPPLMTMGEAVAVWRERMRAQSGRNRRPGPRPAEPSLEQVRDEVLRRLKALGG